jgi:hypothetical protein
MRNIELHTIESAADIDAAMMAGLLDIDDIDGAACSACYEEVGYINGGFYSYAIVLDDIDQWTVCLQCAEAVVATEEDF